MNEFNDTNNVIGLVSDLVSTAAEGALAAALERDAAMFVSRAKGSGPQQHRPLRLIVADFEFAYDRISYAGYATSEGSDARYDIRWPFHRIACGSWMILRFDAGSEAPVVEEFVCLANDEADEFEIAVRLFEMLEHHADAPLVTWGGEGKDLAVLRRIASEAGILLPPQIADPHPHTRLRVDLCKAVSGGARFPHLPEYAAGSGIPSKPTPAKEVGPLVEIGDWGKVRDQCLADVLAAGVIGLRHLVSHGVITCDLPKSFTALADAAGRAEPASPFVRNSFAPWARQMLAAARLRGAVYRAA